jgi:esterase/lipase superfamily enzyme
MFWVRLSLLAVIGQICFATGAALAQGSFIQLKTTRFNPASGQLRVDMRQVRGAVTELRFRTRPAPIVVNRITFIFANRQRQVITRRVITSPRNWSSTNVRWPRGRQVAWIIFDFTRHQAPATVLEIQGRRLGGAARPGRVAETRPRVRRRYYRRHYRRHDRRHSSGQQRSGPQAPQRPPQVARRRQEEARQGERHRQIERSRPPGAESPRSGSDDRSPPIATERSARPEPSPDCVKAKVCTLVRIFFGTNRKKDEKATEVLKRVSFGSRRQDALTAEEELTLGRAIVTVPKVERTQGEISRPGFLEGFWDRYWRGVTPEGDPSRHFVIVRNGIAIYANPDDFIRAITAHRAEAGDDKDHAFVFVHGYNTKFDDALFRTAQIAYDLGGTNRDGVYRPFGTPFMFSWPSAGGQLFYPYDQESARFAVAHLKIFLDLIINQTGVRKIHLIAHSMGNVPLLNALAQIAAASDGGTAKIDQVVLAAPDMDAVEFRKLAARIKPITKGVTMYSSSSDAAMDISRTLHNNLPRAGDVVTGRPVIAGGVQTIDISLITTCYFCTGHSEYVEQRTLLEDIKDLVHAGLRPPHVRNGTLHHERIAGAGEYWRYQP